MAAAAAANRLLTVTPDEVRVGVRGAAAAGAGVEVGCALSSSSSSSSTSPHLLGETGKAATASLSASPTGGRFAFLLSRGGVTRSLDASAAVPWPTSTSMLVEDAAAAAGTIDDVFSSSSKVDLVGC